MRKSTGTPSKRHNEVEEEQVKHKRRRAPGKTIDSRENQLINMAAELAAKQIRNGTASSQVITHFLKLGSTLAGLEKAKLEQENKLLFAKTAQIESQKKVEELYANAVAAMRSYSGIQEQSDEDD